jgi:hypothetical protein
MGSLKSLVSRLFVKISRKKQPKESEENPVFPDYILHEHKLEVKGPVETEYGWGWSPVITYWRGDKRVHFYDDYVEAARVKPHKVLKAKVDSWELCWEVIRTFLSENGSFEDLPDLEWKETEADSDKVIPHPPDRDNPSNLTQVIGDMKTKGAKPWRPFKR